MPNRRDKVQPADNATLIENALAALERAKAGKDAVLNVTVADALIMELLRRYRERGKR